MDSQLLMLSDGLLQVALIEEGAIVSDLVVNVQVMRVEGRLYSTVIMD